MDTTLAIIKPHAITDRLAGTILAEVSKGFEVRSLELFNISKVVAGEFYEVYRGVVAPSEFTGMVDQITSGPCLVMELASKCESSTCLVQSSLLSKQSNTDHRSAEQLKQHHKNLESHGINC